MLQNSFLIFIYLFCSHLGAQESVQELNRKVKKIVEQGEYQKALSIAQYSLKIATQKLGKHHSYTMDAINNLAIILLRLRRFKEAAPLLEKRYKYLEKTLGMHQDVFTAMNDLGELHYYQRNFSQALQWWEKAWKLRKKTLGKQHQDTLTSQIIAAL